jgi:hypothetical protein
LFTCHLYCKYFTIKAEAIAVFKGRPIFLGVTVALLIIAGYILVGRNSQPHQAPIPPGTVVIQELPPLITLVGTEVPFEGKVELPQPLAGSLAAELTVVRFYASGENANKSVIKLVWEDGSIELIPAGTVNLKLAPDRRAKQISIVGYCMNERRVFKDQPRKGQLTWEIRYSPAN